MCVFYDCSNLRDVGGGHSEIGHCRIGLVWSVPHLCCWLANFQLPRFDDDMFYIIYAYCILA